MKLGELLAGSASDGVYRAPSKDVAFKVLGKSHEGLQTVADAKAVFAFVSESEREEARIAAEQYLRKKFPAGDAPRPLIDDVNAFYVLQRALRDPEDPAQPFALTVEDLKRALHRRVVLDLAVTYDNWCSEEFPERIDDDDFQSLVEEAKKKSLGDLLSSRDSSLMLRALPSLVAAFGKSQTPTSGAGEPG